MITLRPAHERGRFDHGWLDTAHSFSFGEYHDPRHMGFRTLRVLNEDVVAPSTGFDEHPHRDMEILTYILSGSLAHKDSLGTAQSLEPGDVQRMTAGSGIRHAEFNPSPTTPVHLLQIWIRPRERALPPAYGQTRFPIEQRRNTLRLIASPDAAQSSLSLQQDARVYASVLEPGHTLTHALAPSRGCWIQVAKGALDVNSTTLRAGDGAAVEHEPTLTLAALESCEFLLFDLA